MKGGVLIVYTLRQGLQTDFYLGNRKVLFQAGEGERVVTVRMEDGKAVYDVVPNRAQ